MRRPGSISGWAMPSATCVVLLGVSACSASPGDSPSNEHDASTVGPSGEDASAHPDSASADAKRRDTGTENEDAASVIDGNLGRGDSGDGNDAQFRDGAKSDGRSDSGTHEDAGHGLDGGFDADAGIGACDPNAVYGDGVFPPSCFRVAGASSPARFVIPANPKLATNSSGMVSSLLTYEADGKFYVQTRTPFYFSKASDPLYTVHCGIYACPALEGQQVHIPSVAVTEGGGDSHIWVLDQSKKTQFDFWASAEPSGTGGTLDIGNGGLQAEGGNGLGCQATAAGLCEYDVTLHIADITSGKINHALELGIPCAAANHVYPSDGSDGTCSGVSNPVPEGSLVHLKMTESQIAALSAPAWEKTVLLAMATYGVYVTDTGSGGWSPGLLLTRDHSNMYTVYGQADPWEAYFSPLGVNVNSLFLATDGVDLADNLEVIDPCEVQGNCG